MAIQKAMEFAEEIRVKGISSGIDEKLNYTYHNSVVSGLIRADRKAVIEEVIKIFDSHASFDPHGYTKPDMTRDGIIHCTDELRAEIAKFGSELD